MCRGCWKIELGSFLLFERVLTMAEDVDAKRAAIKAILSENANADMNDIAKDKRWKWDSKPAGPQIGAVKVELGLKKANPKKGDKKGGRPKTLHAESSPASAPTDNGQAVSQTAISEARDEARESFRKQLASTREWVASNFKGSPEQAEAIIAGLPTRNIEELLESLETLRAMTAPLPKPEKPVEPAKKK
jgi:hypothetical protein